MASILTTTDSWKSNHGKGWKMVSFQSDPGSQAAFAIIERRSAESAEPGRVLISVFLGTRKKWPQERNGLVSPVLVTSGRRRARFVRESIKAARVSFGSAR